MRKGNHLSHERARINRAFGQRCEGVQISVLDMGAIFKEGHKAIDEGCDDAQLGDRIATFVEGIRKN